MTNRTSCWTSALALAAAVLLTTACRPAEGPSRTAPAEGASAESPQPTYEPAYPDDVSADELSSSDVEQQGASHSHGGAEHRHGADEDHSHEGPDAHQH
ncbi:MAG: hypothetical protein AAF604_01170 [Acidobacteriota bacterium]